MKTLQAAFIAEMKQYNEMAVMFCMYDCVFLFQGTRSRS